MYILASIFLDGLFGDPKKLPHPKCGVEAVVRFWEKRLYPNDDKKQAGVLLCSAVHITIAAAIGLILLIAELIPAPFGTLLYCVAVLYLLYTALAWRSLKDQTLPIALSLFKEDLPGAQSELSRVVGRDTKNLDEAGAVRAAVETIGEKFVDGVFSVLFFAAIGYAIGGPAGAVILAWLFKAVNIMNSMVGPDNERYRDFGYACAKLDDAVNFIPARLGGAIILLAGACLRYPFLRGWGIFMRDRSKHKGLNSAHGESAFAGLLGIKLGGGAEYSGVSEARTEIGDDLKTPEAGDILRAHSILDASVILSALILLCLFAMCR